MRVLPSRGNQFLEDKDNENQESLRAIIDFPVIILVIKKFVGLWVFITNFLMSWGYVLLLRWSLHDISKAFKTYPMTTAHVSFPIFFQTWAVVSWSLIDSCKVVTLDTNRSMAAVGAQSLFPKKWKVDEWRVLCHEPAGQNSSFTFHFLSKEKDLWSTIDPTKRSDVFGILVLCPKTSWLRLVGTKMVESWRHLPEPSFWDAIN